MVKQLMLWIWEHLFQVVIIGVILANLKMALQIFVIQPIQGSDGKTSMPELAQYILILLLIYMVYQEAMTEAELFTGEKFLAVAGAVAGIAGVQIWKNGKQQEADETKIKELRPMQAIQNALAKPVEEKRPS